MVESLISVFESGLPPAEGCWGQHVLSWPAGSSQLEPRARPQLPAVSELHAYLLVALASLQTRRSSAS